MEAAGKAADLVGRQVAVITAVGGTMMPRQPRWKTPRFHSSLVAVDPVDAGLIKSVSRPGGNVTEYHVKR